jgi:hypothetical protein
MDPLKADEWKQLRELVSSESREKALDWLKKNCFVTGDVALSCIRIAEDLELGVGNNLLQPGTGVVNI